MKKFKLLIISLIICISSFSETYQAQWFASKEYHKSGWTTWSGWTYSGVSINIDSDNGTIDIYSKEYQHFVIRRDVDIEETWSNGHAISMKCIDFNGKRCTIDLRRQNDGILQLYIYYKDVAFAYSDLQ